MKRNVDLTLNNDFRRKSIIQNNIITINGYNIIKASQEIILTGIYDERECKKIELGFGLNNQICDCCGTNLPWRFIRDSSLCDRCDNHLYDDVYSKHWWLEERKLMRERKFELI